MALGASILSGFVPDPELASAQEVEIDERIGRPVRYRLRYPAVIDGGDVPFLTDPRIAAGAGLAVHVPSSKDLGAIPTCLVSGPVTGHRLRIAHGGQGSYVDVLGADKSIEMDREHKVASWAAVDDGLAVSAVLLSYFTDVRSLPTTSIHDPLKHTLVQNETDYAFVMRLARRNGRLFWVRCSTVGIDTAHFADPALLASASADLVINLAGANLDDIELEWDVERPTSAGATQLDLNDLGSIDGSSGASLLPPLGATPFATIAAGTRSALVTAPADDSGGLGARARAVVDQASWFLKARCSTSVEALGRPVRTHELVDLRGAGARYSGNYYVSAVRHLIDGAAHRMHIELARNAWEF